MSASAPISPESFVLDLHNAHLIRRAHQRALVLFQKMMGESNLTPTQFAVAGTLFRCPGISQKELSHITAIDTATLSNMIRRLERDGIVTRVESQTDQRVQLVQLTPKGMKIAKAYVAVSMRLSEHVLEPIPKKDRARFVELLRMIG